MKNRDSMVIFATDKYIFHLPTRQPLVTTSLWIPRPRRGDPPGNVRKPPDVGLDLEQKQKQSRYIKLGKFIGKMR